MRGDTLKNAALVADALASNDVEDRRQAAALLGAMDGAVALPLLLRALGDVDWRVRKEATRAARSFADPRALVRELVKVLAHGDDVGLRNAAVDVLGAAGHVATPALAVALPSLDADGKKLAIEALGRTHDAGALEPLASMLSDADENVRRAAVESIAGLGGSSPERVGAILMTALADADAVIRLAALHGLSALGIAVPWAKLSQLLADPAVRSAAIEAASHSDAPDAAPAVVDALAASQGGAFASSLGAVARLADGPLHAHVGEALVSAGATVAARLVALAASDEAPERRAIALQLAALARSPAVLPVAIASLGDDLLASSARDVLVSFGAAALPALLDAAGDAAGDPAARAEIVEIIADVALDLDPARVPWHELCHVVRAAAEDGDRRLSSSAIRALARIGTLDDIELVARASRSSDAPRARVAERALGHLVTRFPGASRAWFEAHRSDEAWVLPLATLLGALSGVGRAADEDMRWLAHAATAGDAPARRAAVAAAAEMSGPVALEILSLALADEEHEVQLAAARGLGHLAAVGASHRRAPGPRDTIPDDGFDHARPTLPTGLPLMKPAGEVLELVERSGVPALVAAAVRAIGDAIATGEPDDDLLSALASFARHAPSHVALAAVDALSHAPEAPASAHALAAALEHVDDEVVRAAVLKLAARDSGWEAVVAALSHASPLVRRFAAEALEGRDAPQARAEIQRRLAIEQVADVKLALEAAYGAPSRRGS